MAEFKGIEYLRAMLSGKRTRIDRRYSFYEMKHMAEDMRISTPPQLQWMMYSLGWCGKAVDSLADRLVFGRFANDAYNLGGIFQLNNQDVLIDSVVRGALICSCSFVYITQDAAGNPLMQAIDARNATGIIDPITNMLTEGYAILEVDDQGATKVEAYLKPHETDVYEAGKYVRTFRHPAPYPLLVPVIYKPDAKRPFGHSRITRACMDLQDSAARTIKRSEISAEFYSYPQRYVLGMDPDAAEMDKWKAAMSAMLRIDKDDNGDTPTVGSFTQQSMAPHLDQLKALAGIFAGETGLTLDDLGFPAQNPSSSEAIKASHETLRLMARKAQRDFGVGLLNAGYLAACLRDGQEYRRNQLYNTVIKWEPIFEPDVSFPDYFTTDKLNELTGI